MRTPVFLVCGQGDTDAVVDTLHRRQGTAVLAYRFDGQVVRRTTARWCGGEVITAEVPLEVAHGCLSCTIRNDLLVQLRRLHRRGGVDRVVVRLMSWLEPEPICVAVDTVRVRMGPGFVDGPAARDVYIAGVLTCVDTGPWLMRALSVDDLPDGRTVAQVVVGQAEFADVIVLTEPEHETLAVLRRLAPLARITVGTERIEMALAHLEPNSPRGRSGDPHGPLLAGAPSLQADGEVALVEFAARRPFHPQRLHDAIDVLLDGVIRAQGRLWLANRPDRVLWLKSAGGGLRIAAAGRWVAAMELSEAAYVAPERRAFADLMWDEVFGDRHITMTVLVCGARPADVVSGLDAALLTDDELAAPADWIGYADPFGDEHHDPCDETPTPPTTDVGSRRENGEASD